MSDTDFINQFQVLPFIIKFFSQAWRVAQHRPRHRLHLLEILLIRIVRNNLIKIFLQTVTLLLNSIQLSFRVIRILEINTNVSIFEKPVKIQLKCKTFQLRILQTWESSRLGAHTVFHVSSRCFTAKQRSLQRFFIILAFHHSSRMLC